MFKILTDEELKGKVKDISNCPGTAGSACDKSFGVFTWKHHCRICASTFCDSCCPEREGIIDQQKVRVCSECAHKVEEYKKEMVVKRKLLSLFGNCKLPACRPWTLDKPLAEWTGIVLDSSGAVVGIVSNGHTDGTAIEGYLSAAAWHQLGTLFPLLVEIDLRFNRLVMEGDELELGSNLPPGLKMLNLSRNQFRGSVNLAQLPEGLTVLNLSGNGFSGSADLTKLPKGLTHLELDGNLFEGTVDLTQLPKGLTKLNLTYNQFSGTANLTKLPEGLRWLHLAHNKLDSVIQPATGMPSDPDFHLFLDDNVKRDGGSQAQPAAAAAASSSNSNKQQEEAHENAGGQ